MLYPEIFRALEKARWTLSADIPWDAFDGARLSEEQAQTIRMNAITEWAALPAAEMFLRDSQDDSDFSAFMSIWFYEEQKHALALIEYLQRFRPELVPTETELAAVRFPFDPAPQFESLMLHYCGEVRLAHWYRRASRWHSEPVISKIYSLLARDEARHASAYMQYMKKAIAGVGNAARLAFAKIGVLMTNERTSRALHPTNLHVNKALYPEDSVQSRLPDPQWLEHWLDQQIQFGSDAERTVCTALLRKLSGLLGESLSTARDLRSYRKRLQLQVLEGNA